ncbi:MAG: putative Fe-S protein YdhL (DUF1289 family) [Halioglobus sp.]|jgi:predicted Fe-S protein YdhL (DUF1289 family)
MSDKEPRSPCVSICVLDEKDICTACYRSASEITDWFMASADDKREILRLARGRQEASTIIRLS